MGRFLTSKVFAKHDSHETLEQSRDCHASDGSTQWLTPEQKRQPAPLIIDALMRQDVDPVTEAGKEGTL
jgi:hypothetical protein